jgi:6-phospho-3-hexuloisomerase
MITQTISDVPPDSLGVLVELLIEKRNRRVLVLGAGRSGLVGRAFALRLLHLGYDVYVLGDTLVPSITAGDLVIAISGSGSTKLVLTAVEAAKNIGATVLAFTSFPDSPLGRMADYVIHVKGRVMEKEESRRDYFARQILGLHEPLAPLGTLFEDTCMVLLDAMIPVLMEELKLSEEELRAKHANIE